jgi:pimeloyl-ACP methyl ester carboxylesterase
VAQAFARKYPERLSGLFFFNCPYPGIGERWVEADHINEIWYQSFNQQPWAASLVGESRKTCGVYIVTSSIIGLTSLATSTKTLTFGLRTL